LDQLLQHLLNATVLGGTYALLGIGLTLIFGIMRVVNFTHGELYAFGVSLCAPARVAEHHFSSIFLAVALGPLGGRRILLLNRGALTSTLMLVMISAWI
jgi:branched-chain amino acid transport system permease protein